MADARGWVEAGLLAGLVAFDLSRAGVILIPLTCAGLLALAKTPIGRRLMTGVAVANAVLPATHIIANVQVPIRPARQEISLLREPPPAFSGKSFAAQALRAARAGRWREAEIRLFVALRLKSEDPAMVQTESLLRLQAGQGEKAVELLKERLVAHPSEIESAVLLAEILMKSGKPEMAQSLARRLLEKLPSDQLEARGRLEALLALKP